MKTILMISHSSSLTGGGEEDFLRLIKFLHGKYNLIGVFPEGKKIVEYKKYVSDFLIIPNRMFPFTEFKMKNYLSYSVKASKKYFLIKNFIKTRKIDLAYIHSSVCIYEAFTINNLNIPYILAVREFINPVPVRKRIYRYFLMTAKKIIVISKILNDEFKKIKIHPEKIITIYPGIEKSELSTSKISNEKVFLTIGNIFPEKGQDKVIEALAKTDLKKNNIILKIIGANVNGKYFKYLKDLISKLNLEKYIIFTGEIPKEDVLSEIAKSYAVIISSSFEGFSLVALEAFSNRKPLISTPVGVIPEIVKNGENGLIYDFSDSDMLAKNIDLLLNDSKLYDKISENGFRTFEENFDLTDSLEKIDKEIQSELN